MIDTDCFNRSRTVLAAPDIIVCRLGRMDSMEAAADKALYSKTEGLVERNSDLV